MVNGNALLLITALRAEDVRRRAQCCTRGASFAPPNGGALSKRARRNAGGRATLSPRSGLWIMAQLWILPI